MKLKKMDYLIACIDGPETVSGYAVDADIPVRMCVHHNWRGWRADHYDTGYAIAGWHNTRTQAIEHGIAKLKYSIANGDYIEALRRIGYAS